MDWDPLLFEFCEFCTIDKPGFDLGSPGDEEVQSVYCKRALCQVRSWRQERKGALGEDGDFRDSDLVRDRQTQRRKGAITDTCTSSPIGKFLSVKRRRCFFPRFATHTCGIP